MIQLNISGITATIDDGVWDAENPDFLSLLQLEEAYYRRTVLGSPSDPDPDMSSALHVIQVYGGIIEDDSQHTPPEYVEGRIY